MERRDFLELFSLSSAAVPAAAMVAARGGEKNLVAVGDQVTGDRREVPYWAESVSHANYDLLAIPAGVWMPSEWSFFSNPIGSHRPGVCANCGMGHLNRYDCKTIMDTNQLRGNSFPPPESRTIDKIVFVFSPKMNEADRADLATRYYFEFRRDEKIMARGPLARCRVVGDVTELVSFENGRRKPVSLDAPFAVALQKPVYIAPLQHFAFELRGEGFEARSLIELYAFLDGEATFAIQ